MFTPTDIYMLLFTNIVLLCIGVLSGYILSKNKKEFSINEDISIDSKTKKRNQKISIDIDDTKYVSKINTEGLEKKYETLGETKKEHNDTISSVNKLKKLKG